MWHYFKKRGLGSKVYPSLFVQFCLFPSAQNRIIFVLFYFLQFLFVMLAITLCKTSTFTWCCSKKASWVVSIDLICPFRTVNTIWTSVWGARHPNTGWNIQHQTQCSFVPHTHIYIPLYEKGIMKGQIKSMETTHKNVGSVCFFLALNFYSHLKHF